MAFLNTDAPEETEDSGQAGRIGVAGAERELLLWALSEILETAERPNHHRHPFYSIARRGQRRRVFL